MSLFPWLPFTNLHELNLDWILKKIRGYDDRIDEVNARQDEIETMLDNVEDTIEDTAREVVSQAIADGDFDDELSQLVQPIETQITAINQNISSLDGRIDVVEEDFEEYKDELQTLVNQAEKRFKDQTVLFVGGSYTTGEVGGDGIISYVVRIINAGIFKTVYTAARGGSGFTGKAAGDGVGNGQEGNDTLKWQTVLSTWINNHSNVDLSTIDKVIIFGGFNDVYSDYEQIRDAIASFAAYARPLFTNAQFYLGFCAWCGKAHSSEGTITAQESGIIAVPNSSPFQYAKSGYLRRRLARIVEPAYSGCGNYGIHYLGSAIGAMHNYYLDFLADGYHPTNQGHINMSKWLISKLAGGGGFIDQYNTIECRYNQDYVSAAGIQIPDASEVLILGQGTCTETGIYFNPIIDGTAGSFFQYTALDDVGTNQDSINNYQLLVGSNDRACILPTREISISCFIRGTFRGDSSTTGIAGIIRIYQKARSDADFLYSADYARKSAIPISAMDARIGVAIVPLGGKVMQAGNIYNVRMIQTFLPYSSC